MLYILRPIHVRLMHRFPIIAWFLDGWKVPSASQTAGHCLFFWFYFLASHVIAQKENNYLWSAVNQVAIIGAIIFILLAAMFTLTEAAFSYAAARQRNHSGEISEYFRKIIHGCVSALPTLLFALWGIAFLNGYPLLGLNRAVLFLWGTYLFIGWLIAFQRGVANVQREQRTPR